MSRRIYGAGPLPIIARFRAQFAEDGAGGYIYRLRSRGRPISVSAEERDRFVDRYVRTFIILYGSAITVGVTYMALRVASWHSTTALPSSDPLFWIGLVLVTSPFFIVLEWLSCAPARALKGRPSIGLQPSADEIRADRFRNLTYGNLTLTALVGGGSYAYIADGHWDRRWLFLPPLVVLFAAVQAVRKWHFERRRPTA